MKPLVIITRPVESSLELQSELEKRGFANLCVPLIQISFSYSQSEYQKLLSYFSETTLDWLIFTSVNGVEGLHLAETQQPAPLSSLAAKVAAVGSTTSAKIAELFGREADLVADPATAESLAATLLNRESGSRSALFAAGSRSRDALQRNLVGWDLRRIEVYRTENCQPSSAQVAELAARNPQQLVYTFFSPSAFKTCLEISELVDHLKHAVIASIGPVTSEAIRSRGYQVAIEASTPSPTVLSEAIQAYFEL